MMKIKMRVLCLFLSLICAIRTAGLSVRGPAMPLHVQLGASVTLPCSVDTPIPLRELQVQWMREDSGSLVHLFLEGKRRPESQSPAYSGRAEFFTEEISKGNFSLLLRNVTTEDKGMYKCVVHTARESSEAKVKIDTEWLVVTGADVPVFAYAGEDVILNCSVDTHVPLRELEVEWMKTNEEIQVLLFMGGQYRPESQPERFRGRAEFFSEEIPKGNFSMKLRDVKTEDRGEFMCTVHTYRESVNATAWLQEQGFSTLHWCVLGLTMAAAVFAVLSCIPAVCWIKTAQKEKREKKKKKKGLTTEEEEDEEEEEEDEELIVESKGTVLLFCLQVSVPCILLSIAFAIWGKIESSVGEAYVCSTINLVRILVIFKVAPYVLGARHKDVSDPAKTGRGPGRPQKRTCFERLTNLALPLDNLLIRTGMNSVLLHSVLTYHAQDAERKLFSEFMFVLVALFDFSAVFSSGIMLTSVYNFLYYAIQLEIFFLIFSGSTLGFTAVFILWFIRPGLYKLLDYWKSDLSKKRYESLLLPDLPARLPTTSLPLPSAPCFFVCLLFVWLDLRVWTLLVLTTLLGFVPNKALTGLYLTIVSESCILGPTPTHPSHVLFSCTLLVHLFLIPSPCIYSPLVLAPLFCLV
ncbi:uncharacterized protein LOC133141914 isoform X2 [Conger conger]|uniref:uncharacterized protein LOC133141914 isoform X2 n=1 Tax=Conger conger TaxID=82655 RepID=UPI002A5AEA4A|nr:uncharacterized protein LOC133141914 isoform X2 [Conger conger]